jgi:hypothetical protein
MDTLHPRAEWESVGDKWFRKTQQYTAVFDLDLDLDNYKIVGAPYAGAIGMICHSSIISPAGELCFLDGCEEAVHVTAPLVMRTE